MPNINPEDLATISQLVPYLEEAKTVDDAFLAARIGKLMEDVSWVESEVQSLIQDKRLQELIRSRKT